MVIAIMGDSYDRVVENKVLNSTRMRIDLIGELTSSIATNDKDDNVFMFVITPDENMEDEDGTWEGSINKIAKAQEKSMQKLEESMTK